MKIDDFDLKEIETARRFEVIGRATVQLCELAHNIKWNCSICHLLAEHNDHHTAPDRFKHREVLLSEIRPDNGSVIIAAFIVVDELLEDYNKVMLEVTEQFQQGRAQAKRILGI